MDMKQSSMAIIQHHYTGELGDINKKGGGLTLKSLNPYINDMHKSNGNPKVLVHSSLFEPWGIYN